ncbi:hypothetical protein GC175_03780 [bacterium]|nr:hypothetical protein [bacterium]
MPILYGLTDRIAAWQGRSAAEVADAVRGIGGDGVFLKHFDLAWIEALQRVGVRVFLSHAIFVDRESEELWQRWPDSRPITATGAPAPQEDWYRPLRPTHNDVRSHRLAQLTQLVTDHPVDGVWLDFIRWPARWEKTELTLYDSSFDDDSLAQFGKETHTDVPAGAPAIRARWIFEHVLPQWIEWRGSVIERFVIDAAEIVRRHRPSAKIGLFTIPWIGIAAEDNTVIHDANHRIVAQNLARLGRHVDVISPMVYHRLCRRSVTWVEQVARYAVNTGSAAVWPVIEAIDPPEHYSAAEFANVFHMAQRTGSGEVIIFKLDGVLSDPHKQTTILTMRNT